MDVADVRPVRDLTVPCGRRFDAVEVEWLCTDPNSPVVGEGPLLAWVVAVDLDPIPFRVSEVQRLADPVI